MPVVEIWPPVRRQAEGLRLVVELAPRHAALRLHRAPRAVDPDALHRREVDHQAAVADGVAGDVVTAPADGHQQMVGPREIDRPDHVGGTGAPRDQQRACGRSRHSTRAARRRSPASPGCSSGPRTLARRSRMSTTPSRFRIVNLLGC